VGPCGITRIRNDDDVADGQYYPTYQNFDLSGFYLTLGLKSAL
jgi:hypothetical protein